MLRTLLTVAACLALPVVWGLVVGWLFERFGGETPSEPAEDPPEYFI